MGFNRNIISNLISRIAKILASFLVSVVVARALGDEGFGVTSYIIMIFTFIGSYCHLGVNDSFAYFMRKHNYNEEEVINNNLTILGILSILISITVIVLYKCGLILTKYSIYEILVCIILFMSILLNNFANAFYAVNNRFIEFNSIIIKLTAIKSVGIVILFLIGKLNIISYLIIYTFDIAIAAIVCIWNAKFKYRIYLNLEMTRNQLQYGLPKFSAGLVMFLNYRVDQFMIKMFIGFSQLGVYSLAVNLAELIFMIPSSVEWVLSSFLLNNNDKKECDEKTITTIKGTFYICTVMAICGLLCSPLIIIIYGEDFRGAVIPFSILLIGVIFASIGKMGATYYFAKGDTKTQFVLTSFMLVVNLVGNVILLPTIGISGAAIASTLSYIVYGMGYIILLKRREKIELKSFFKINLQDCKSYITILKRN